ncbi:MAG: pentapeptide repeat-containing protein, partial [Spirochaetia bacterium]|nr:pentapeptide repeat-containing protein [Spirochaetia bacterium]
EMADPSVVSAYRNTGCGDGYRIYIKVNNETSTISEARYTTTGCGFSLAALSMACKWLEGKTLEEAENITSDDIENLFEFPERRKNYPQTAAEAVKKAIHDYKNDTGIKPEDRISKDYALETLKKKGNLREEKLTQVVLENENLEGVDFSGSNMSHAFLVGTNLKNAVLKNVKLRGAFLNGADLENADLSGADLRWAKLSGAKLDGTILDGALYDAGTRLDPKYVHLFDRMKQQGKESYIKDEQPEEAGV